MERATIGEEIFNSILHGLGAVASLIGLVILEILAVRSGNRTEIITFGIYGAFLFLLFLSSTLYHGIQAKKAKEVFRLFDHIFIYFLIAGTYTPVLALVLKVQFSLGLALLGAIWGVAIAGVLLKIFLINNPKFVKADVFFYLGMSWLLILVLPAVNKAIGLPNLILLLIGGISYTVGTIFYRWHKLKFHHAYWHMFVLCGGLLHYLVILRIR